jgi:hypothetical protein
MRIQNCSQETCGNRRRKWDGIKMDLGEVARESMDWT